MNSAFFSLFSVLSHLERYFFQNYYIIFKNKMQEKQNRHIAHTSVSDVFSIKADLFLALYPWTSKFDVSGYL